MYQIDENKMSIFQNLDALWVEISETKACSLDMVKIRIYVEWLYADSLFPLNDKRVPVLPLLLIPYDILHMRLQVTSVLRFWSPLFFG